MEEKTVLENIQPTLYEKSSARNVTSEELDDDIADLFDAREVFDIIKNIRDPEHPVSLEVLHVVEEKLITVDNEKNTIRVLFTPTIPHCSMALLIGLTIRIRLLRSLPARFKVNVLVTPGTHQSEREINKQIGDKERVAAAMENVSINRLVNECTIGA